MKSKQGRFAETTMLPCAGSRISLKRTWKRMPRLQRNLIMVIIAGICLMFLYLLASQEMDDNIMDTNSIETNVNGKMLLNMKPNADISHHNEGYNQEQPFQDIESNPNDELNENMPVAKKSNDPQTDRAAIMAVVHNPGILAGTNGVTIEKFLRDLEVKKFVEKQHFYGAQNERQKAVVKAFQHSWKGYKKYAWGHDNLKPISKSAHDWLPLGQTIIGSLDTMYIMGLEKEFGDARNWVSDDLNFKVALSVKLYEVSVQILGSLLSAFHLSADKVFLMKAVEAGNRLLPAFLAPMGIPYPKVNMAQMWSRSEASTFTRDVTTIQLEFRELSRITNVSVYESVAYRVTEKFHALKKENGLVPKIIDSRTATFINSSIISLGYGGVSYYEYLLKQWIQTGRAENDILVADYRQAIEGVIANLVRRTPNQHFVYISEVIRGRLSTKMDLSTCSLPGTLLLGHHFGMPDSHLQLGRDLLDTCYQTYMLQPTQLAPEVSMFASSKGPELDIYHYRDNAQNRLQPEFIESLYYFYALTGNSTYQDMGWIIFQAFEKYAKLPNAYASIENVGNASDVHPMDMMDGFWLAETLKYFYLLFSDNRKEIDLDKWIFNTKAHPLPIRSNWEPSNFS